MGRAGDLHRAIDEAMEPGVNTDGTVSVECEWCQGCGYRLTADGGETCDACDNTGYHTYRVVTEQDRAAIGRALAVIRAEWSYANAASTDEAATFGREIGQSCMALTDDDLARLARMAERRP